MLRTPRLSRVLLILVVLLVVTAALVGLPTWRQGLVEAAIIGVVVALACSRPALRTTVSAAPRPVLAGVGVVMIIWSWSQLHEVPLATYPFMSWHMYGEPLDRHGVVGYRLAGEQCNGETRVLPSSGGGLGRRPVLAFGVRRAYSAAQASGADQPRALARTDSLLRLILSQWNDRADRPRLCAVHLQQITVPAEQLAMAPLPAYVTVRRYVAP